MSEIKLLPCPLCGEDVELYEIEPHTHVLAKFMPDCKGEAIVECKCGCSIMKSTKEEAVKAWNTRKPIEDMVEQLEKRRLEYEIAEENACNDTKKIYYSGIKRGYEYSKDIVRGGRE